MKVRAIVEIDLPWTFEEIRQNLYDALIVDSLSNELERKLLNPFYDNKETIDAWKKAKFDIEIVNK